MRIDKSAKQPIPDRQNRAEIAVGLRLQRRVMDCMHSWRHDQPAQAQIDGGRQTQIGMRKEPDQYRAEQIGRQRQRQRRQPQPDHQRHHDQRAEQRFERMVALCRGDIYLRVAVVHQMQTPEPGNLVEKAMLSVAPGVEQ